MRSERTGRVAAPKTVRVDGAEPAVAGRVVAGGAFGRDRDWKRDPKRDRRVLSPAAALGIFFAGVFSVRAFFLGILVPGTLALGVLAPTMWAGPALASSGPWFSLRPGVLVSRSEALVFQMGEGGSVDAVELSGGLVRWSSMDAAKPLALLPGHRLLAQVDSREAPGKLQLAILDLTEGGEVLAGLDFRLPARVHASVVDRPTGSFAAEARVARDLVVVSWSFTVGQVGLHGGVDRSGDRQLSGTVAFDLISGEEREAKDSEAALFDSANAASIASPLPAELIRQLAGADSLEIYRPSPEIVAATDVVSGQLRLRRWRAADGEEISSAFVTEDLPVARTLAADSRHLQVATRALRVSPSPHEEHRPYWWTVLSLETGEAVVRLAEDRPSTDFFVVGRTLVDVASEDVVVVDGKRVERALRLRAFDTETGTEKWSRPLAHRPFPTP